MRQASSPVCRAASIQQYFNHLKPGETLRSPISQAPLHSRNLVPCQNVKTMVTEHKERAKRPRLSLLEEQRLVDCMEKKASGAAKPASIKTRHTFGAGPSGSSARVSSISHSDLSELLG